MHPLALIGCGSWLRCGAAGHTSQHTVTAPSTGFKPSKVELLNICHHDDYRYILPVALLPFTNPTLNINKPICSVPAKIMENIFPKTNKNKILLLLLGSPIYLSLYKLSKYWRGIFSHYLFCECVL
jgi:hypothetical protein